MRKIAHGILTLILLTPIGAAMADTGESALYAMQSIRDVEHIRLDSKIVNRPFHLLIKKPVAAPDCDTCIYPTVFLLDGGGSFPMMSSYLDYLRLEEQVPYTMLVGISYAGNTFEEGNYRSTDFTAPSEERDFWGGASNFQRVLDEEIFPLISEKYPLDNTRRIIFGNSLGGQFVLFTAQTRPDLFYGHISSNPALHRNLDFFLQDRGIAGHTKLFVAVGSNDSPRFKPFSTQWIDHWVQAEKTPFILEAREIPGYGHLSLLPESFRQGLIWLLSD